jgi:ribosome-associated toxin RatA of RatAB toxin-antitoxin module
VLFLTRWASTAVLLAVSATVAPSPEGLHVEAGFHVAAPRTVVWAVLTDYENIPRFVSSMRQSRIVARDSAHLVLQQEAVGRLMFFRRRLHTTLWVEEVPMSILRFEDVLHEDFDVYRGEWRITESDSETHVSYQVTARPITPIPQFAVRPMFQRAVQQLLTEIEKEIEHRAAVAERLPSERSRP